MTSVDVVTWPQVAAKSVAFRGLSVRMGMATGKVTQTSVHPLTRRTVYHGPLVQLVETIVGVAHGGQVICDSATFIAMSPVLHDTAQRVPAEPNYNAMGDANHRYLHNLCTSNKIFFHASFYEQHVCSLLLLTSNMHVFIEEGLSWNSFCTHCLVIPYKSDNNGCAEHLMALCCCSVLLQCCNLSLQTELSQAASHEAELSKNASHKAVLSQVASHEAVLSQVASHEAASSVPYTGSFESTL